MGCKFQAAARGRPCSASPPLLSAIPRMSGNPDITARRLSSGRFRFTNAARFVVSRAFRHSPPEASPPFRAARCGSPRRARTFGAELHNLDCGLQASEEQASIVPWFNTTFFYQPSSFRSATIVAAPRFRAADGNAAVRHPPSRSFAEVSTLITVGGRLCWLSPGGPFSIAGVTRSASAIPITATLPTDRPSSNSAMNFLKKCSARVRQIAISASISIHGP